MLGRTYRLQRLEIIGGPQVVDAWPAWLRILLRGAGVHDFLWWHDKVSAGAAQRRVAATAAASAGQGRLAAGELGGIVAVIRFVDGFRLEGHRSAHGT
jgi:hypothetical protein